MVRITMVQLNLSPEEKLLLYCSRLSISDDLKHKIDEIFSNGLDWSFILECSVRQGISPLFYWNLKNINHDKDVPPEVIENLKKRYYNNLALNMVLYDELGKVLKAFKRVDIETIVLKGAFLAEEIYKNIGLRPMSDIDLLIKKEDLQRANTELTKLMYIAKKNLSTELNDHQFQILGEELEFVHKSKNICIDIHWNIQPPLSLYNVDINEFWHNAKPAKIAGIEVLTFAPENLLQHLCLHIDKHINSISAPPSKPLRDYCDIAEVTRHYKERINWNYILQSSQNRGIEKPIFQGLYISKNYFGAFIPENILNELEPFKLNIVFEEIFRGKIKDDPNEKDQLSGNYLVNLKEIDGVWNKSLVIFRDIFPSREFIMYSYSIKNEKQIYMYYLIRSAKALRWGLAILQQLPQYIFRSAFRK